MRVKAVARRVLPLSVRRKLYHLRGYIPPRLRYGKVFWDTYNFLNDSQWWGKGKLEEYQIAELNKLLNHAYKNVAYYRRIFDERCLKPKDIQTFDDLKQLPYLTKDSFKENADEMIVGNVDSDQLVLNHTSGTTGKPLQFYEEYSTLQKELAFVRHQWGRVGFKPGDRLVGLRGAVIEGKDSVEYDPYSNTLRLSPRLDTKEIVREYLERVKQFGTRFIHGYPSAIGLFAAMIRRYGFAVPFKLQAIFFTSEVVYSWERQITEEVFGCRVFSHYGMAENAATGAECETSNHYHCVPQYGITEIDADSKEIIGTSFLNYANPFIRYRTTDVASEPIYSGCKKCGRQCFPILAGIEGRTEDFLITTNGVPVSPAVITHPMKDFKAIKSTQVVQKAIGKIQLRVVPWNQNDREKTEAELQELCQQLKKIIGSDMTIEGEILPSIPIDGSGKFRWIVSEVSKDSLRRGFDKD